MHPASMQTPSLSDLVHQKFPDSFPEDFFKKIDRIDKIGRAILNSISSNEFETSRITKKYAQELKVVVDFNSFSFEKSKFSPNLILGFCGAACVMAALQTARDLSHNNYETTRNTLYNTLEFAHSLKQNESPAEKAIIQEFKQFFFTSDPPPQCFFHSLNKLFPNTFLFTQVQEELERTYKLARDLFSRHEDLPNLFKNAQDIFSYSKPFQNQSKEEQFKSTFLIACLLAARKLIDKPSSTAYDNLVQLELEDFIKVRLGQFSSDCRSLEEDPFWQQNSKLLETAKILFTPPPRKTNWVFSLVFGEKQ